MAKAPSPFRRQPRTEIPIVRMPANGLANIAAEHSHGDPELIGFPTVITIKSTLDTFGNPAFVVEIQGAYRRADQQVVAAALTKVATNSGALLDLLRETYEPEFPADDIPDEESLP